MTSSLKTKQQFIELRANNESYEMIAKKLKVSKTTLIAWSKDSDTSRGHSKSADAGGR